MLAPLTQRVACLLHRPYLLPLPVVAAYRSVRPAVYPWLLAWALALMGRSAEGAVAGWCCGHKCSTQVPAIGLKSSANEVTSILPNVSFTYRRQL